jgi:hypothetical protein
MANYYQEWDYKMKIAFGFNGTNYGIYVQEK